MAESSFKKLQGKARELDERATEGLVKFIPPELRKLKPSLDLVTGLFPSTLLREAGGKTQKFIRSGGKDYKSGIGALVDTASVGIPLAFFGKLAQRETPKAIEGVTDFFMTPSVKTVDDAVDVSRRDFLKKAPVAVAASAMVPPVLRDVGELISTPGAAKVGKTALKGPVAAAVAKANTLRDLYFGKTKVFSDTKDVTDAVNQLSKSADLSEKMDKVTLSLNKDLDKVLKYAGDFSKFSDDEIIALGEMKLEISHMMRSGKGSDDFIRSGDPLRTEKVSKALDKAIEARGLRSQIRDKGLEQMMQTIEGKRAARKNIENKAEGGIAGLSDQARDMFKGPKGIGSYESFMVG